MLTPCDAPGTYILKLSGAPQSDCSSTWAPQLKLEKGRRSETTRQSPSIHRREVRLARPRYCYPRPLRAVALSGAAFTRCFEISKPSFRRSSSHMATDLMKKSHSSCSSCSE